MLLAVAFLFFFHQGEPISKLLMGLNWNKFHKSVYTGNVTKILYWLRSLSLIYPSSGKPIYCAFHFVGEFFNWFVMLYSNFLYAHSPSAALLLNEIS